jgi:uncharacterized protein (DUF885 family)
MTQGWRAGRSYIEKLAAIDPAGLPDQVQLNRDLLLRGLIEQQEEARFKTWELPVNQQRRHPRRSASAGAAVELR